MIGKQYGRLVVVSRFGSNNQGRCVWECRCECGQMTLAPTRNLTSGSKKSCGCLAKEKSSEIRRKLSTTHGMSNTKVFRTWQSILTRCYNKNYKSFHNYGGRGIEIHPDWKTDFVSFFHHVGHPPCPSMTLDRIDVNMGYTPGNVRWASRKEQANNTRRNKYLTLNGVTKTQQAWSELIGVKRETIYCRLKAGWTVERALGG